MSRNAGPRACEFILAIGLSSVCSRLSEISSSFARKSPTRASRVIGAIVVAAVLAAVERAYCPVLEIGHFRWHSGLPTLSGGGVLDGASALRTAGALARSASNCGLRENVQTRELGILPSRTGEAGRWNFNRWSGGKVLSGSQDGCRLDLGIF